MRHECVPPLLLGRVKRLKIKDTLLKDLAGNSFVAHVVVALLIGLFAHMPADNDNAKASPGGPKPRMLK